ncbi:MAG TPA: hypothetical protein VGE45_12205 [Chloroflexia bacterium]|jgi:hypothetical protein
MMITNQQRKKHLSLPGTILFCSALLIGTLATGVMVASSAESMVANGTPNYTGNRHARIIEAIMANSTYTYEASSDERKPHSSAMCVEADLVNIGFNLPPDLAGGEIILTKTNGEKVLDAVAKYEGSVVTDYFTRMYADVKEQFVVPRTAIDVQLTEGALLRGVLIVNTEEKGVMQFTLPEKSVIMGSCPEN